MLHSRDHKPPPTTVHLLKIGGNELDNADFRQQLAAWVAAADVPVVLVHGGGAAIAELQQALGLEPQKVNGLRVTDDDGLRVAEMALSGFANKLLVRALTTAGVYAVGLSGVDGQLLVAVKKQLPDADLGLVGTITSVNVDLLTTLLAAGITPVISPISAGADGQHFNVNADEAAAAIAGALAAEMVTFISNVPGVLKHGTVIPTLTTIQSEQLITDQIVTDGMIPKVNAALGALAAGARQARIGNLAALQTGGGTTFIPSTT